MPGTPLSSESDPLSDSDQAIELSDDENAAHRNETKEPASQTVESDVTEIPTSRQPSEDVEAPRDEAQSDKTDDPKLAKESAGQNEGQGGDREEVELIDEDLLSLDESIDIDVKADTDVTGDIAAKSDSPNLDEVAKSDPFESDEFAPLYIEGITRESDETATVCPVCGTVVYAKPSEIGSKKKCPDCYTMIEMKGAKRDDLMDAGFGMVDLDEGFSFPVQKTSGDQNEGDAGSRQSADDEYSLAPSEDESTTDNDAFTGAPGSTTISSSGLPGDVEPIEGKPTVDDFATAPDYDLPLSAGKLERSGRRMDQDVPAGEHYESGDESGDESGEDTSSLSSPFPPSESDTYSVRPLQNPVGPEYRSSALASRGEDARSSDEPIRVEPASPASSTTSPDSSAPPRSARASGGAESPTAHGAPGESEQPSQKPKKPSKPSKGGSSASGGADDPSQGDLPTLLGHWESWVRAIVLGIPHPRYFLRLAVCAGIMALGFLSINFIAGIAPEEPSKIIQFVLFLVEFFVVVIFTGVAIAVIFVIAAQQIDHVLDDVDASERWFGVMPDGAFKLFLTVAVPFWLGTVPGVLLGLIFAPILGSVLYFLVFVFISAALFSPILLASAYYNGSPFQVFSNPVFSALQKQPKRWGRYYLGSFVLLVGMIVTFMILALGHALTSLFAALAFTAVIALYIQLTAYHMKQLFEGPVQRRD